MLSMMVAENICDIWETSGSARMEINLEAILQENPEMIIIQQKDSTDHGRELIAEMYGDNPAWNALTAVKEGRVYYLDPEMFHYKANSRYGEAYEVLGGILYPDIFQ